NYGKKENVVLTYDCNNFYEGDCIDTAKRLALDSKRMCNAYEYYDGFQDKDFDYYEHIGSVRPPPSWKESNKNKTKETDSPVDDWYDDNVLAAEIMGKYGIDYNNPIGDSDLITHDNEAQVELASDSSEEVMPVSSKKRD
ncbi:MAG: hypothetical protein ACKPKO_34360, partial [Candidatus Fonsibacter sp.]